MSATIESINGNIVCRNLKNLKEFYNAMSAKRTEEEYITDHTECPNCELTSLKQINNTTQICQKCGLEA